jgi:hypothetical protein
VGCSTQLTPFQPICSTPHPDLDGGTGFVCTLAGRLDDVPLHHAADTARNLDEQPISDGHPRMRRGDGASLGLCVLNRPGEAATPSPPGAAVEVREKWRSPRNFLVTPGLSVSLGEDKS